MGKFNPSIACTLLPEEGGEGDGGEGGGGKCGVCKRGAQGLVGIFRREMPRLKSVWGWWEDVGPLVRALGTEGVEGWEVVQGPACCVEFSEGFYEGGTRNARGSSF